MAVCCDGVGRTDIRRFHAQRLFLNVIRLFNHVAIPVFNGSIRIGGKIGRCDGDAKVATDAFIRDRKRAFDIFDEDHNNIEHYIRFQRNALKSGIRHLEP